MTGSHRLEVLIQRAVDGELTPAQRHELINSVADQPEGWKHLACAFLEEQLIAGEVRQSASARAQQSADDSVQPLRTPKGFWYRHPALSTVVTLCVAFVLGLSIPWGRVLPSSPATSTPAPTASTPRHTDSMPVDTTSDRTGRMSSQEALARQIEQLRRDLQDLRSDGLR